MLKGRDILEFILKYRRGKAFKDFSTIDIMSTVSESSDVNGLGMVVQEDGTLSAIAITFPYESIKGKFLHVHSVLTTRPGDLKTLLILLQQRFPNFTLTARRNRKFKVFTNTPKLIKRLWATSDKAHKREWQTSLARSRSHIPAR